MSLRIIRKQKVKDRTGISFSQMYKLILEGKFPPQIKLGPRASGWIESEIDAINAARITGKSDDEIRDLVKTLMEKRQKIANEILVA